MYFLILFLLGEISSRPKRACTNQVRSYQESHLSSKNTQERASKRTLKSDDTLAVNNRKRGRTERSDNQVRRERGGGWERNRCRSRIKKLNENLLFFRLA